MLFSWRNSHITVLLLTYWLVFRRSFQFTVIYLHHLYMGIKMSLQSVLRLMRAVKMTFTVLTHKRYTSGKERSFKPPSDSMIIKGLCQVQLVPWIHKNIQSTRQLNVSTTCKQALFFPLMLSLLEIFLITKLYYYTIISQQFFSTSPPSRAKMTACSTILISNSNLNIISKRQRHITQQVNRF